MKRKCLSLPSLLLLGALLVAAAVSSLRVTATHAATQDNPRLKAPAKLPPSFPLPDLTISVIAFGKDLAPNNVRVEITNQGKAKSGECDLTFKSEKAPDGTQRVWLIKVPEIEAGKSTNLRFKVSPLKESDGPWMALVDRPNIVKESNETNNKLTHGID